VTPRSMTGGHPAVGMLREAGFDVCQAPAGEMPEDAFLQKELPGCCGYLAGVETVAAELLGMAPGLQVIARNGAGVSNVDLEACARLGIEVMRVDGGNAASVAELTIGLMLGVVRQIAAADFVLKERLWVRRQGMELEGKTLGVVGLGQVGRRLAAVGKAMGMKVIGCDPAGCEGVSMCDLSDLLEQSDVVSLHCPPAGDGPLVDLGKLKRGAILINTARHELVDTEAMIRALDEGRIAGYGTDVLDGEPPKDWALARHPMVLATPHIGAFTREAADRCAYQAVENLIGFLG
jgi:D-3-phosphoglycerate dehydrogenase